MPHFAAATRSAVARRRADSSAIGERRAYGPGFPAGTARAVPAPVPASRTVATAAVVTAVAISRRTDGF
ncbi:hypothetical protein [Streptomyces scopuliridis]|uniref:hypothetical protein n=1 Tax=Streptomyces scopuliridis TaxID=452529 RepID=UPI0036A0DAE9